ncbi:MAG: VOC family protein [Candidatus Andersenbacteria bacterium]
MEATSALVLYNSPSEFLAGGLAPIVTLNQIAEDYGLVGRARADHLCYKCGDHASYLHLREVLEPYADYNHVAPIGGRMISYLKLREPLSTVLGPIWYIELSDQKPDGSQHEGFDHVEVYPTESSMRALAVHLEARGLQTSAGSCPTHETIDVRRIKGLKLRIEAGPLVEKIAREEMGIKF